MMNRQTYELFDINSSKFKIIEPSENNSYYMVLSADQQEYEWLDKINKYCVMNNIGKHEIKKKLEKYLEKQGPKKKNIDTQLDHYTLKSKLQNLISSSVSPLIAEKNSKSLFDKEIVAGIIINEYMICSKWLIEEKNANLTLSNGNIFVWNLCLSQFKNTNINCDLSRLKGKSKHAKTEIEVEICFHGEFYPNYPPVIKIINPVFKNSLGYRITNSKMIQLDYWTPVRTTKYIIERIIYIIEKYGEIDVESSLNNNVTNKGIIDLENNLMKFASFTDSIIEDDEIDSGENYIKFASEIRDKVNSNSTANLKNKTAEHWKKGTGYGHYGSADWNINEYIKSQQDKDEKLAIIIQNITKSLQQVNNTSSDFTLMIKILEKSLLIPYLKQQFKSATPLEIHKKEDLFKLYLSLLESIATEKSIYLFDVNTQASLYNILEERKNEFEKALSFDKENEIAKYFVNIFNNLISPMFKQYVEKKDQNINENANIKTDEKAKDTQKQQLDIKSEYKQKLTELRFGTASILDKNFRDEYKKKFNSEKGSNWKLCQKRLATELTSLMPINQLPIEYDSSIFVRVDDDNPMIIRALITGPPDTPYDSGCLIFDIYTPSEYPQTAPFFWFMNHGGNRFNPNLYNCGKVCLSILGTYSGPNPTQSEKWNSNTSTLLQVLISIQAQILIDEPYFNEPGYESSIGTEQGKKQSANYNANIRLYTMKSTVRDLLLNPKTYGQFEDVITEHFRLKKDYILKTYEKWCSEAPANMKKEYDEVFKDIKKSLG
jgi:ubiquitin-protein ligase